jgi:DnaJ-class molecular chaperone
MATFVRQATALLGHDIHRTVWIRPELMERGARIKVLTPSGERAVVRIPPETGPGRVILLPGMGLTAEGYPDDQYVHVEPSR